MKKSFLNRVPFLVSLLIAFQLLFLSVNVSALPINNNLLPPSNLTFQLTTPDDVKLTWTSVYGANGYNVYGIADGQMKLLGTTTSTNYSFSNLSEGSYTYVVSTLSPEGESGPCAPISVDIIYPDMLAPTTLTNTIRNGNDVILNWSTSKYAQTYNIYQVSADGENTLVTSVTGSTYTITNVPAGTYKYAVSAVNSLYGESPISSPLQVEVVFPTMPAPSNLTYKLQNGSDVILNWGTVTYANSYKVYELIDEQEVIKTTVSSPSATISSVSAGNHIYVVHSYSDRFGESPEGSQVSTVLGDVIMAAPSNFSNTIKNGNDIVLTWDSISNATSYKIYQIIDEQKVLKSTVTTGTTVTYTNMPAGDYNYEIHSYSTTFGESPEGSQVAVTVVFPDMQPPANLVQAIKNATDFTLSWEASSYATSYKVYQIVNGQKVLKSTVTGTTVTYTKMAPGEYTFEVHSYSTRFGESLEGSTLVMTLNGQTMEAPTNLTYSIVNGNDISLKWTAAPYATSYKIYQVIDGQNILQKTVTTASATFSNMPTGDYKYVITSVSTLLGESPSGAEVALSLVAPTMTAPANLTYKIQNGNSVALTWGVVTYANSYKVYELVDGEKVLKNTVTSLSTTISNVAAGNHTYIVHSVSTRFGESAEGSQVSVNLQQQVMMAPTNLTYSITNGNNITLKWTAPTYATSYKIYQVIDGQNVLQKTATSTSVTFMNMPTGDYHYVVTSVSSVFGESPSGAEVTVPLVAPTMVAPTNLAYSIQNGNDVVLTWGAVTYANSYNVYELVDGQKVLKTTVFSPIARLTGVATGNHDYVVHSVSTRFGESQEGSQISVTIDYVEMMGPNNLTYSIANGNDITLKWSGVTYATAYRIYQVKDGQKSLVKTVSGTAVNFTNMPAGDYTYEVTSYSDRFGESAEGATTNFKLIWPVIEPPVLKDTINNVNNITLYWQPVNWADEYRLYEIIDGTRKLVYKGSAYFYKIFNLSEGTKNYELIAYSTRFGESAPSNRITETIIYPDMESPKATLKLIDSTTAAIYWNFVTYANGYNVYEIIDGKPVLLTENLNNISYQVNNLSYAEHQYYVTSFSNSFGESQPSNIVVAKMIVDTEPPVTTSDAPTDWVNQSPVVVNLSATDNDSGVANTYYSINDGEFTEGTSITVDKEGVNKISFYSVDNLGNKEVLRIAYVRIDKTAPTSTSNAPATSSEQEVTVNLSGKDELSGIDKFFYSIDGSDYVEGSFFTVKGEGIHKINFYSIDEVGNTEAVNTVEVKIEKSDKIAPVTTTDVPANWTKEDVTVNLTATDEQSGVAKTFYAIDGSDYVEGTTFTIKDEGIHKINFYSVDVAGNIEAANTVEVKIDKTAPVTTASVPENWTKEDVTVNLIATDEQSGVAKTFYAIDGSDYVEGKAFTIKDEGIHKINFYSVDEAGNIEAVKTVEVKIDKTAPVTTSDAPANWTKEDVTVNLTATDEQSGVAKTFYSIDGSDYVEGKAFTIKDEGIHKINFYSVDEAGNIEAVKTVEVRIDKTAPVITMDLDKEYKLGDALQLTYMAKDNLSGIVDEKVVVLGPNETAGKVVENNTSIQLDKPGVYNVTVTVTDAAGLSTTIEKQVVVYIPATIEVTPKVIKGNKGIFTVRASVPVEYGTEGFDLNTATLNGIKALTSNNGYYNQAKIGQFKFERSDFTWTPSEMVVEFRCYFNGYLVVGQTTVKVQK